MKRRSKSLVKFMKQPIRSFRASQVRLVSQYVSALIKNDKKSLEEFFKEYEKFLEVWA